MNQDILKQREQAFDYLFKAVVVTDLQGTIIEWSKGAEALYGYSDEQAIGQPVNILHVPEDTARITSEVISTVEKKGKWSDEIRMLHKNGHIGWVESMCVPLYNKEGQIVGALGINRDITKRKNKESFISLVESSEDMSVQLMDIGLTDREIEILIYFARGFKPKEISNILNIQPKTIHTHKRNIFDKMNFKSNRELVTFAIRNGLIHLEDLLENL